MTTNREELGYSAIELDDFTVVGLLGKGAYSVVLEGTAKTEDAEDVEEYDDVCYNEFTLQRVAGDGNRFFHAVAHQLQLQDIRDVNGMKYTHDLLQGLALSSVEHDARFRLFFTDADYLDLSQLNGYVDHCAVQALAEALQVTINVHNASTRRLVAINKVPGRATLTVLYNGHNHYDSLIPIPQQTNRGTTNKRKRTTSKEMTSSNKKARWDKRNVAIKIFKEKRPKNARS
jgi:hypothetical protein